MKSTKTSSTALALAALALTAFAGCGGSSSGKPLSRAQFTAKANAICRRVVSAVDWAKVKPEDLPRVVSRLAALEEKAATELDELTPPASLADEWRLVVDGFRLTGPEFRQIAQQVKANGAQTYNGVLPLSNAQHERGLAAAEIGLTECAKY